MLVSFSPTRVGLVALMLGGGISLHEARFAIREVRTWRPVLHVLRCRKCSGVSIAFYSGAASLFQQFYIFFLYVMLLGLSFHMRFIRCFYLVLWNSITENLSVLLKTYFKN